MANVTASGGGYTATLAVPDADAVAKYHQYLLATELIERRIDSLYCEDGAALAGKMICIRALQAKVEALLDEQISSVVLEAE